MPLKSGKWPSESDKNAIILAMKVQHPSFGTGVCIYSFNIKTRKLTSLLNLGAQLFWGMSQLLNPNPVKKPNQDQCQTGC